MTEYPSRVDLDQGDTVLVEIPAHSRKNNLGLCPWLGVVVKIVKSKKTDVEVQWRVYNLITESWHDEGRAMLKNLSVLCKFPSIHWKKLNEKQFSLEREYAKFTKFLSKTLHPELKTT